ERGVLEDGEGGDPQRGCLVDAVTARDRIVDQEVEQVDRLRKGGPARVPLRDVADDPLGHGEDRLAIEIGMAAENRASPFAVWRRDQLLGGAGLGSRRALEV